MIQSVLIRGATIITLDAGNRIVEGDVLVSGGRIAALNPVSSGAAAHARAGTEVIEAAGKVLIPGFVQTHVHLCQTLFRGAADDLALIEWLKDRIWPLEAAHSHDSVYASARLGIAELIRGGTTCALTMETVHHTEAVFKAVEESGFRAIVGKCMMDRGQGVPAGLLEDTETSLAESLKLLSDWHGKAVGRIGYCFAPRFALSCSRNLLERVASLVRDHGVIVHTHASENRDETRLVESETGRRNVEYLDDVGLVNDRSVLAHCIWLDERELEIIQKRGAHVAHCPSSNLKLGSGIANTPGMIERGISVSLGADGAPCNNRLDMFTEMRTAALIQKVQLGPKALPALRVLQMATIDGARALGLGDEIGSIEIAKRADLVLLDLSSLHTTPRPDLVSTVVYAAEAANVEAVLIDGRIVMREGRLITMDEQAIMADAQIQAAALRDRAQSSAPD
jgi:5-methylthioadenosine/S-adenosylhomocysteine deaminase